MARTGRPSIFRGKDRSTPVKAYMTPTGKKQLHVARRRLAHLVGWKVVDVSDGDVVEYLARGHEATVVYLTDRGLIAA